MHTSDIKDATGNRNLVILNFAEIAERRETLPLCCKMAGNDTGIVKMWSETGKSEDQNIEE